MDKLDIIMWIMGGGFALMMVMWSSLHKRMDNLDSKIDKVEYVLSARIDKMDEKLTDIDRRLCRLEGAFSSKDCCMIKDERQMRKAE